MPQHINRHPVDRLFDLRTQIKELEAEEQQLREYLLGHPQDRIGEEHVAVVRQQQRSRLDVQALAAEVGHSLVDRFRHRWCSLAVWLQDRERDGDA
jgi:hypothetical protein